MNGEIDMKRAVILGGRLVIEDLKREDDGYFECIAKNSVATIVTSTLFIIEGNFISSFLYAYIIF